MKSRVSLAGAAAGAALMAIGAATPATAADDESDGATLASAVAVSPLVVTIQPANGPALTPGGAAQYGISASDVAALPLGANAALTDVLTQLPSVSIDQNQQIHIRDTEGPQFQYQLNGVLVPLDIDTNPPFLSMMGPQFIRRLDLTVGVLPSRYSYATGGVVDIATKDGCQEPGGSISLFTGMLGMLQPSGEYGGCAGKFSYYVSGLYSQSDTAFSSATPGPTPVHDWTNRGQGFGFFTYDLDQTTRLSVILSGSASNNELPNVPGLAPQFTLAGATPPQSRNINSHLDFRDTLAIVALNGHPSPDFSWQLAYAAHDISERFTPDVVGELAYQGVASDALHHDTDNTLQGDATWVSGQHTISAGFYAGLYHVTADDTSRVFPVDPTTGAIGEKPLTVVNNDAADNGLFGVYVNDLWQATPRFRINLGLRWDRLSGFTNGQQLDPTLNLSWNATPRSTLHVGYVRYMQVPSFLGISPTAQAAFANTTAAGPPGIATPLIEDDNEWDAGVVRRVGSRLTLSADSYFELTHHYLDTGQFGVVPIFAPFNYGNGYMWGAELAAKYQGSNVSTYANLTIGRNEQKGVVTGQFNFDPTELAYIDTHSIALDHQPLVGGAAGATYSFGDWQLSADVFYSSGFRAGFADLEQLPRVFQANISLERRIRVPGVGVVLNRVTIENALDRVNLIRPADGIGIFQAAYGPRFTVFDALTLSF